MKILLIILGVIVFLTGYLVFWSQRRAKAIKSRNASVLTELKRQAASFSTDKVVGRVPVPTDEVGHRLKSYFLSDDAEDPLSLRDSDGSSAEEKALLDTILREPNLPTNKKHERMRYFRLFPSGEGKYEFRLEQSYMYTKGWFVEYQLEGKPVGYLSDYMIRLKPRGPQETDIEVMASNAYVRAGVNLSRGADGLNIIGDIVTGTIPVPPSPSDMNDTLAVLIQIASKQPVKN